MSRAPHPLRWWWLAPAVLIVVMVAAWAYHEQVHVRRGPVDTRFLAGPQVALEQEESGSEDAWLRLGWLSRHSGLARYHELGVVVDGTRLAFVGRDPEPGEWSALRDGVYLGRDDAARSNDILVIGSESALAGTRVRLLVEPCNCYATMPGDRLDATLR